MTQPTIEQMIKWCDQFCAPFMPSDEIMISAIRTALTAQSANTLPLDEVPEYWFIALLCQDVVHFSRHWQCRIQHQDGRTRYAEGATPAEALRAAIARVTP